MYIVYTMPQYLAGTFEKPELRCDYCNIYFTLKCKRQADLWWKLHNKKCKSLEKETYIHNFKKNE